MKVFLLLKVVFIIFLSAMCLFSLYAIAIVFQSNRAWKEKIFGVFASLFAIFLWMIYIFATVYPTLTSAPGILMMTLLSLSYLLVYGIYVMLSARDFISTIIGGYLLFFSLTIVLLICISVATTSNTFMVLGATLIFTIVAGAVYVYIFKFYSAHPIRLLVTIIMYLLVIGGLSCVFAVTVDSWHCYPLEAFYQSLQNSFALPQNSNYIWIHILQFFACRIIDFTMFGIVVHLVSGYIDSNNQQTSNPPKI